MTPTLPEGLEAPLKIVRDSYEESKDTHRAAVRKWNRYYRLYRSYSDWDRSMKESGPRDVDAILRDGKRAFGESMFIPYIYSVIETQIPRIIVFNPRVTLRPGDPKQDGHVDATKLILDRQQTRTAYPLTLQRIAKSGLMYGLGVGDMSWCVKKVKKTALKKVGERVDWIQGEPEDRTVYEGAEAGCIDIFDFIWDNLAFDGPSMRKAIKRVWRPNSYLKEMFDAGIWKLPEGWDLEDVIGLGSDARRDEVWADRQKAAGFSAPERRGDHLHEVWEFWDGSQVITVLDRMVPVQMGGNPYWHAELPFQVYRPTEVPHEMVGIGEPEAVEELQLELNEMRTSRRDNSRLAMQRPFAYFEGLVNPSDIEFGPGTLIAVDGDPRELLFPIPLQDIPGSSYNEEQALKGDLDRTSGIDDNAAGVGGESGPQTATGAQLVQQAASMRITNKTLRLNAEVVVPQIRQQLELNQQKIVATKQIPGPPRPGDMTSRAWSWYTIGPEQLAGEWEVEADADSMTPDNTLQQRNDSTLLTNQFRGDPDVDQQKLKIKTLELAGIKNPESWMVPKEPQVPAMALDIIKQELAEHGAVDPQAFDEMVMAAVQAVKSAQGDVDKGTVPPGEAPPPTPQPA